MQSCMTLDDSLPGFGPLAIRVPPIRDDRTASWVKSGDSRTRELGMAWSIPS